MNANTNGFYKALFWDKRVFRCSIIDVGKLSETWVDASLLLGDA